VAQPSRYALSSAAVQEAFKGCVSAATAVAGRGSLAGCSAWTAAIAVARAICSTLSAVSPAGGGGRARGAGVAAGSKSMLARRLLPTTPPGNVTGNSVVTMTPQALDKVSVRVGTMVARHVVVMIREAL
jgi:hypothetical protein